MVQAYLFFYEQVTHFFLGEEGEFPLGAEYPISDRADECFQTLRNALMVVLIDLQADDDPQVIFKPQCTRRTAPDPPIFCEIIFSAPVAQTLILRRPIKILVTF